jgi:hypothetical protein
VTFHPKGITSNLLLKTSGAEFTSISKSMAELNIPWLDILKIDIEGGEWSVFLEMLEEGMPMPFTQILIGRTFISPNRLLPLRIAIVSLLKMFAGRLDRVCFSFATSWQY